MEVVVVVLGDLDDTSRTPKLRSRADIDRDRAGSNESIDEILRQLVIDVTHSGRRGFSTVFTRIIDVDVEPDLM